MEHLRGTTSQREIYWSEKNCIIDVRQGFEYIPEKYVCNKQIIT